MILPESITPWDLGDRYPRGIIDCTSVVILSMIDWIVKGEACMNELIEKKLKDGIYVDITPLVGAIWHWIQIHTEKPDIDPVGWSELLTKEEKCDS